MGSRSLVCLKERPRVRKTVSCLFDSSPRLEAPVAGQLADALFDIHTSL